MSAAVTDIVDAQIHIGPGRIDETLAQMDALGVRGALIDEYWLRNFNGEPHHALPRGYRPVAPTAELAAQLHPARFSYLLRVNRHDPEAASLIRLMRDAPGCRALRIDPGMNREDAAAFADGGYDAICAAAAEAGLPLFVFAPDDPAAFARLAQAFPDLRIAVDHCGVFSNAMRATIGGGLPPRDAAQQLALFDQVVALGRFDNVALKWGHASGMFDTPAWPGEGLWPILRRALDGFGAQRVMWASDFSVNQRGESWADLLYGVKGDPGLSVAERDWVLGGALRRWIDWPGAA